MTNLKICRLATKTSVVTLLVFGLTASASNAVELIGQTAKFSRSTSLAMCEKSAPIYRFGETDWRLASRAGATSSKGAKIRPCVTGEDQLPGEVPVLPLGEPVIRSLALEAPPSPAPAEPTDVVENGPQSVLVVPLATEEEKPAPATLQDRFEQLNQRLKTVQGVEEADLHPLLLSLPSLTSNIPTAYGGSLGTIGVGIGYQDRPRFGSKGDGDLGVVLGLGNPKKIGFDLQLTSLDISQPTHDLAIGFKLHRVLPRDYVVALGLENETFRGSSDSVHSWYGVVTKKINLKESRREMFSRLYLTAGLGSGRFKKDFDTVRGGTGTLNVFGGAALSLGEPATVFLEWGGQDLNIGASLVPFRNQSIVITPTIADVTGSAGNGRRFLLTVGYFFAR